VRAWQLLNLVDLSAFMRVCVCAKVGVKKEVTPAVVKKVPEDCQMEYQALRKVPRGKKGERAKESERGRTKESERD